MKKKVKEYKTLKQFRRIKGMTINEVCEATGMNASVMSQKENGKRRWRIEEIVKLCRLYGADIGEVDFQIQD